MAKALSSIGNYLNLGGLCEHAC